MLRVFLFLLDIFLSIFIGHALGLPEWSWFIIMLAGLVIIFIIHSAVKKRSEDASQNDSEKNNVTYSHSHSAEGGEDERLNDRRRYAMIGSRIMEARLNKDYELDYLAKKINITSYELENYEMGISSTIPIDVIEKLAVELDVSPVWLLNWRPLILKNAWRKFTLLLSIILSLAAICVSVLLINNSSSSDGTRLLKTVLGAVLFFASLVYFISYFYARGNNDKHSAYHALQETIRTFGYYIVGFFKNIHWFLLGIVGILIPVIAAFAFSKYVFPQFSFDTTLLIVFVIFCIIVPLAAEGIKYLIQKFKNDKK